MKHPQIIHPCAVSIVFKEGSKRRALYEITYQHTVLNGQCIKCKEFIPQEVKPHSGQLAHSQS